MTEAQLRNAMDAYGSTVYRLALTRMQNIADAEDVYQEVFLRLWKQAAEDWDGDRAKAWLIRTTLNRCADLHGSICGGRYFLSRRYRIWHSRRTRAGSCGKR